MNTHEEDTTSIISHESGFSTTSADSHTSKFSRRSIAAPMRRWVKRLSGVPLEMGPPKTPRMNPSLPQFRSQLEGSGTRRLSFNGWKRRRSTLNITKGLTQESQQPQLPQPLLKPAVLMSSLPSGLTALKGSRPSLHTIFHSKLKNNTNENNNITHPFTQPGQQTLTEQAPIAKPEETELEEEIDKKEENSAGVAIFRNALKTKRRNIRMTRFMLPQIPPSSGNGFVVDSPTNKENGYGHEDHIVLPPTDINGLIMPLFTKADDPSPLKADNTNSEFQKKCPTVQLAEIRGPTLLQLSKPNVMGKTPSTDESADFENTDEPPRDQLVAAQQWSELLQKSMSRAVRRKVFVAGKTLFNIQPQKGIEYLIKSGVLVNHPNAIVKFLNSEDLSCQAIGEYFGRLSDPLAVKVTQEYINKLEFKGLEVDQALRYMLWYIHPEGESQKIEFLLQTFKESYARQNPEKMKANFKHSDTLIVVAYSIMMLHTDLYNPNVRRHATCMTLDGFINNHRGIDDGEDLNPDFLRGIYERVSAHEFKSIPDLSDKLREIDQLFTGPLKSDRFVERHRRFIAWTAGYEVVDVTAKRPLVSRTNSQLRGVFIFNDMLIIGKPTRSYAVDELLGIQSPPVGEIPLPTHRRLRSADRHITSPTPPLDSSSVVSAGLTSQNSLQKSSRNQQNPLGIYSTKVPTNCSLLIRHVISLGNVQVLVFESEYYKFGVQLRDDNKVLVNLNLPSGEIRRKFIDWVYGSIEETKEVLRVKEERNQDTLSSIPSPLQSQTKST